MHCSRDLDVLRAQRIMGFCILITHKSTKSENQITWMYAQESYAQQTLHTKWHFNAVACVPQVLASVLYRWLMDPDKVSSVCETALSSSAKNSVKVFADVVWHVLVGQSSGLWWPC